MSAIFGDETKFVFAKNRVHMKAKVNGTIIYESSASLICSALSVKKTENKM